MKRQRQRRGGAAKIDVGGEDLFDDLLLRAEKKSMTQSKPVSDYKKRAMIRFGETVVLEGLQIRYEFNLPYREFSSTKISQSCASPNSTKSTELVEFSNLERTSCSSSLEANLQTTSGASVESRNPEQNAAATAHTNTCRGIHLDAIEDKALPLTPTKTPPIAPPSCDLSTPMSSENSSASPKRKKARW